MQINISYLLISLSVFLFSCDSELEPTKPAVKKIVKDTSVVEKDEPIIDELIQFDNLDYLADVLQIQEYFQEEVSQKSIDSKWIGLFKNNLGYYMAPTIINTKRVKSPCGESNNRSWVIDNDNKDKCVLMLNGVELKKQYTVESIKLKNPILEVGQNIKFTLKDKKYKIYVEQDSIATNYGGEVMYIIKNKIFIKGEKDGISFKQQLNFEEVYLDGLPTILFIGDIDQDSAPDLIMNDSHKYSVTDVVVFLSRCAGNKKLLKKVGNKRSTAC